MPSVHEQLTEQFRLWESRGRGWRVFDSPVSPEPPFVPFYGYHLAEAPAVDAGRRPTFFSSFLRKLSQQISTKRPISPVSAEPEAEPDPIPLSREPLTELQTSLPAKLDISPETFAQFLRNLALCQEPIAFELFGTEKRVKVQFAASVDDAPLVRRQLQAYFPEALFQQNEGTLEKAWLECEGTEAWAVEFGLEREFMFPLAGGKIDPFIGIVGALSELQPGELGLFQVLFQPVTNPWAESITNSVNGADGRPLFVNVPELANAAEAKVTRPLYAAVVRIAVKTNFWTRALQLAQDLTGALKVFAHPQGNALIPLSNEDYPDQEHIEDVLRRQSRRTGMLLNSEELIGFVHLPTSAVRSPVLERDSGRTRAAPNSVRRAAGVLLGHNIHSGQAVPVRLSADQRVHHTHIIGASGTGKSTLLFNLIRQDIESGDGVAVLDPHGDLIEQIFGVIPESRVQDVVLVDLSDTEYPIGFNILSAHNDIEKNLLASDLVSVFRRLSSSWGDQMDIVLQNAILAFLENPRGGTLADLRRFLIEPDFRADFLNTVSEPEVVYYWQKVFPQLTGNRSVGPVLTRLQGFMSQKPIRNMVSQLENRLDFAHIMDTGKIFLARLSEGLGGTENSYMLGTLLVSKFQQIAMSRQAQEISARRDFWLYIDEFDNFITPTMAEILKGARKYRLGLTLAHQELHQLESDPKVASAVATHPFTKVVFRVGDNDAKKLAESFSSFDAQSLKNLENYTAIARVERSDSDFNLVIEPPPKLDPAQAKIRRQQIIAASRASYAKPRSEVEAALLASIRALPTEPPRPKRVRSTQPEEEKAAEIPKPTGSETKAIIPPPPPAGPAEIPKSPPPAPPPPSPVAATEEPSPQPSAEPEPEHEVIKKRIGSEAETMDYTVTYEQQGMPREGRPDIVLCRGDRKIACEVTVTTNVRDEIAHIHRRLQAGFKQVAVISINRNKLDRIQNELTKGGVVPIPPGVGFYSPTQFISTLFDWASEDPEGGKAERAKPRKRHIPLNSATLSEAERKERHEQMLNNLRRILKR